MKNNWKEEFEALFGGLTYPFDSAENKQSGYDNERIINFITSLLEEQKKELLDELPQELGESERNEVYKKGFNFCREKIIHIIKNHD